MSENDLTPESDKAFLEEFGKPMRRKIAHSEEEAWLKSKEGTRQDWLEVLERNEKAKFPAITDDLVIINHEDGAMLSMTKDLDNIAIEMYESYEHNGAILVFDKSEATQIFYWLKESLGFKDLGY